MRRWSHGHSWLGGMGAGAILAFGHVWWTLAIAFTLGIVVGYATAKLLEAWHYVVAYWRHRNTNPKRRPKVVGVDPRKSDIPF